jgi:putative transposase
MARLKRFCPVGIAQHVIQRGNNRQVCFNGDEDFAAYAHWLKEFADKYEVEIHAWVFMTNHVHLLMTPQKDNGISQMMQALGRQYVRFYNYTYKLSGTLWEGRFKSCLVQTSDYLLQCYRYIELNPVRAGMVQHPQDYRWSSYHANALGKESSLRTPHDEYLQLGATEDERKKNYQSLFQYHFDTSVLSAIRTSVSKGLALGDNRFKLQIEENYKRRETPRKAGRKPT